MSLSSLCSTLAVYLHTARNAGEEQRCDLLTVSFLLIVPPLPQGAKRQLGRGLLFEIRQGTFVKTIMFFRKFLAF